MWGAAAEDPKFFRDFPENGGPKRFFIAYIPGVASPMRVEDANECLATAAAKKIAFFRMILVMSPR